MPSVRLAFRTGGAVSSVRSCHAFRLRSVLGEEGRVQPTGDLTSVIVTGAAGHLGRLVAEQLLERLARLSRWRERPKPDRNADIVTGRGLAYVKYELVRTYVGAVAEVAVERGQGRVGGREAVAVELADRRQRG